MPNFKRGVKQMKLKDICKNCNRKNKCFFEDNQLVCKYIYRWEQANQKHHEQRIKCTKQLNLS